jgi:hypothetical protein
MLNRLGNMRELGVLRLVGFCLNVTCRHQGPIDASSFPTMLKSPELKAALR